jgi:hypothetical protein
VRGVVAGVGIVDVGGVVGLRAVRGGELDYIVEREAVGAGLIAVDGELLLDSHVRAHRHIVDALGVGAGFDRAVRRWADGADGNNIHGAVRTVVVDDLFHTDGNVFTDVDVLRQRLRVKAVARQHLLAHDLQVGRGPGRAKQAGHNGDYPEPGENSEQGHAQ